jgi:CheY-like chemotaxis protein
MIYLPGANCAGISGLEYRLDLQQGVWERSSLGAESSGSQMSDGASILLVDDNEDARVTVARILEMSGYQVTQAGNARAAGILLKDFKPALVITDIFMPEGDGFEMLNHLRDQDAGIPVIAISGGGVSQGLDVLGIAERLGAKKVLYKPFTRRQLLDAINEALGSPSAG